MAAVAGPCVQAGLFACNPGGPMFSAVISDAGPGKVLSSAEFRPLPFIHTAR